MIDREEIFVEEGNDELSVTFTPSDDLTDHVIAVYLTDVLGNTYVIGEATGKSIGETMIIACTVDVPPCKSYTVEIGPKDKSTPPVWPRQGQEGVIQVHDLAYHS